MKVKITQKFIYHKVATVEVEVDEAKYQDWIKENNEEGANPSSRWYNGLEDYLGCNPESWVYELEEATHKAEAKFSDGWWENGFGVLGDGEGQGDTAIRWECKELKNERTEGGFEWWEY